jgi:sigma-E factor negative regulatory protein RseA
MIDEQRQRISELQDGELDHSDTSRLIEALAVDPELRETWERYHMIGLAIRSERVDTARRSIADAVVKRIESEPTILAPKPPHIDRSHIHRSGKRRRRVAPFAGVALAAAAAFVAVFVAPSLFNGGSNLHPGMGVSPPFAAQVAVQAPAIMVPAKRWELDRPELVNKLDLFLVTHQETAPTTGAKGMLPYATFVGYEAAR